MDVIIFRSIYAKEDDEELMRYYRPLVTLLHESNDLTKLKSFSYQFYVNVYANMTTTMIINRIVQDRDFYVDVSASVDNYGRMDINNKELVYTLNQSIAILSNIDFPQNIN